MENFQVDSPKRRVINGATSPAARTTPPGSGSCCPIDNPLLPGPNSTTNVCAITFIGVEGRRGGRVSTDEVFEPVLYARRDNLLIRGFTLARSL